MAQNITLMGASYSAVPAVTLPKTGGGMATFTDTSDATLNNGNKMLSGNTAYSNGTKYTGSITSKSAQTYTPTTADQTIASGQYLTGAQTILGSGNLLAENIKNGVDIFGITGTYTGGGSGPYVVGVVEGGNFRASPVINQAGTTVTVYYTGTVTKPLPPMSQLVVADVDQTVLIVLKGGGVLTVGDTFTFTMPSKNVVIMYSGGM